MQLTHLTICQLVSVFPGITSETIEQKFLESWPDINPASIHKAIETAAEKGLIGNTNKQWWLEDRGVSKISKDPLLKLILKKIRKLEDRIEQLEK